VEESDAKLDCRSKSGGKKVPLHSHPPLDYTTEKSTYASSSLGTTREQQSRQGGRKSPEKQQ
jgi:hypothetical protein